MQTDNTGTEVAAATVEPKIRLPAAAGHTDVRAICARQFAEFDPGRVRFEESGDEMLSSAYAPLNRVVALADACRESRIKITGHTDSSGDESWNQRLSLARARAVADWLEARGIGAERIDVAGVGSAVPIADNATRYGRSLNRRIEIRLVVLD